MNTAAFGALNSANDLKARAMRGQRIASKAIHRGLAKVLLLHLDSLKVSLVLSQATAGTLPRSVPNAYTTRHVYRPRGS